MKSLSLLLIVMILSVASYAQITGLANVCVGDATALADPTPGGTWMSSDVTVATIGTTGIVTGVAPGPVRIIYILPSAGYDSLEVTVNALPCPMTGLGSGTICVGAPVPVFDCLGGGVWSSSNTTVAFIDPATGILSGVSPGTTVVDYTLATGCSNSSTVTVDPPTTPITGSSSVCIGYAIGLGDATAGGAWSSDVPAIATVDAFSGVLTGASAGATTITYTIPTGCSVTTVINVYPPPTVYTVSGGGSFCAGGSGGDVIVSGSEAGTSYQLYVGGVTSGAPVPGTGSALDFGAMTAGGTFIVVATSPGGCSAVMTGSATVTVSPLPVIYAVTGGGSYCSGGTGEPVGLDASDIGINYQLYNGGTPVGTPVAGAGGALSFGPETAAGTYTVIATDASTSCTDSMTGSAVVTINPLPTAYAVTGGSSYCSGGTGVDVGLTFSSTGISYQLVLGTTPVGAAYAGTGSSIDFGLQTIPGTYTVIASNPATGCTNTMTGSATVTITSLVAPAVSIAVTPGTSICTGSTASFSATPTNGGSSPAYNWLVNGVSVSTAGSTYSYVPVDGDVVYAVLTSSAACASPTTATSGSITLTVYLPTITAFTSSVACDGSYTLTAGGGVSYVWAGAGLSCTACASTNINPTTSGAFTVTGTDALGCINTATTSVDGNRISGTVSPAVSDIIKVWLVQFNPSDSSITALDSTTTCTTGGTQYYEFPDPASGNYMVKVFDLGGTPGTSGYVPTYSSSAAHWDAAASVSHASSTDNLNVTMIYGTVPAGSGFIGGYIASGAGKGTSGEVPVEGMLVYLTDLSGNILTYAYTDVYGTYKFNLIADGSYIVYPEAFQYTTTPSSVIILSSGTTETVNTVNFKQHTSNNTITPYNYGAAGVPVIPALESFGIYPNPAADNITIQWGNQKTGSAAVVITDVVGREVYKSTLNINAASGQSLIGLDGINNGIYIITIKNENINYSGKVAVEK